jgi:DNA-binding MarR family transcriptional regulator
MRCSLEGVKPSAPWDEYASLYPQVYRLLHRVARTPMDHITPQSWAVLQHLEMSGPLTVSEMTQHFGRAQSVTSEMVAQLVHRGLLRRAQDPEDRRRTLVWLTDAALDLLQRQRDVLDRERLQVAMRRMSAQEKRALLQGTVALLRAADGARRDALGLAASPRQAPARASSRKTTLAAPKRRPESRFAKDPKE